MSANNSIRECKLCGAEFIPTKNNIKLGYGFYCSRKCGGTHFILPLKDRFAKRCGEKEPSGCIPWVGYINPKTGYGVIHDGSRRRSAFGAHRIAWEFTFGEIPDGMHVLHKCDNRKCVNPDHLFLGTNNDNIADKVAKGRNRRGEGLYNAKANDEIVRAIRTAYLTGLWTAKALAIKFGLSKSVTFSIIHRKAWKHVTDL